MRWASEEFETIDMGGKQLYKSAALLAERLVDSPSASIPKACQGWKKTQAAYRLISNDAVNAEAIAESLIFLSARTSCSLADMLKAQLHPTQGWKAMGIGNR